MAVEERDPHTGYMTTGHEWNGIKELNTPVPRPVFFFLIVTAMFAVGRDQLLKKDEVDNVVVYVRSLSDPAVAKDTLAAKIDAGKAVFAANCVTCHGDDAKGKVDLGAPDLTDRNWIYGGDAEQIL